MHVHGMCLRAAGFEKSSSEQENSLLSMRFCKEIEGNSLKFQEKSKTAEGWLNCKENLSTFDKRQWQRCHNYRDSHLNLELVEKFDFQSMLHRSLARISKFCIEI